jgi:hypothetical protein
MSWIEILEAINEKLGTHGFMHISKEIEDEQLKGGTGGEIFSLVLSKLISIKKHQPEVYAVIQLETEWMIAYAKTIIICDLE